MSCVHGTKATTNNKERQNSQNRNFCRFEQNRFWILTNIFVFNVDDDDDDGSSDSNDNDSCNNYDDDDNDDDDVDNDDNDEEGKKQFISYVTISSR